jgi:putative RNA 2'-phosphotransferase
MTEKRLVKISKYLSRHLRHDPDRLGITLDAGGWVRVDDLLQACATRSFSLTREELEEVVVRSDKQRFAFDAAKTRIRANQGHSIEIDLGLHPVPPPTVLYHGTARGSIDSIMCHGLNRHGRHHVHLSSDIATARRVGARHGPPVILEVASARMADDGHRFFVTANGVWLTFAVPPTYLTPLWEIA